MSKKDKSTAKLEEGEEVFGVVFPSSNEAAKAMQPGEEAFHFPAFAVFLRRSSQLLHLSPGWALPHAGASGESGENRAILEDTGEDVQRLLLGRRCRWPLRGDEVQWCEDGLRPLHTTVWRQGIWHSGSGWTKIPWGQSFLSPLLRLTSLGR